MFVLFDTCGPCKLCPSIHLSASTPAEGCELSAFIAWLNKAQSKVSSECTWIYEQYLFLSALKL